jgi:Caspase domain
MDSNLRRYPSIHLAVLTVLALLLQLTALPAYARRLALVIGNDAYQHVDRLNNAGSDAQAVAEALKQTGFTVTLKRDLTLQAMKEALRTFKGQISGGDQVVFYYSGHGVQFEGTNYLIPVDLMPQSQEQVADDAVPLQRVLDDLQDQKTGFALAIIDACRNNPFRDSSHRAIGGRGLAPVTAATGQMILYSAGAGQEALDSLGAGDRDPNGVFTRVLVKEIRNSGIPAEQILKRVRDQVVSLARSVKHEQVPALYDQSLGEFYFVEGAATAGGASQAGSIPVDSTGELEQSYWNRIKSSTDARDFEDYSRAFPKGPHSAEAALLGRKWSAAGRAGPLMSERSASTPPLSASGRNVSVLVSPLTFNKRPVAQAPTVMFEQVHSIPGLVPTLAAESGGSPTTDFAIGGTVLAARPSVQRNPCAAANNKQPKSGCLAAGTAAAPYIARVPVQIDFRIVSPADGRVIPYLFHKTYQFGAQTPQEAEDQALRDGIQEGTLAALQSAGVIDSFTDPQTRRIGYRAKALPAATLLAAADAGAATRGLATAPAANNGTVVSGDWQGTYNCRQGKIGLKLHLTQGAPLGAGGVIAVSGTFEFYPLADNPMAPAGSYEVSGRLAADKIIVGGQRWINRPRGAGMVGLNGSFSGALISGKVVGGGCTQFELKRAN